MGMEPDWSVFYHLNCELYVYLCIRPNCEEELIKTLTCGTCKEIALEPIHFCGNGHTVCGFCVTSDSPVCGTEGCLTNVTKIRNHSMEALLAVVNLVCRNKPCRQAIPGDKMKMHLTLDSCEFR
jgi:hypothetical protein